MVLSFYAGCRRGWLALVCSALACLAARYKDVISAGGVGCYPLFKFMPGLCHVMRTFGINKLHLVKY